MMHHGGLIFEEQVSEARNKMASNTTFRMSGHLAYAPQLHKVESDMKRLQELVQSLQEKFAKNQQLRESLPDTFHAVNRNDVVVKDEINRGAWATVSVGKYRGSVVAIKQPHQSIMQKLTVEA